MKKTIFVHIGSHKTGSTTIQRLFQANIKKMNENVYYVYDSYKMSVLLRDKNFRIKNIPLLRDNVKDLLEQSVVNNILFSGEAFLGSMNEAYNDSYKMARYLQELLKGFHVKIIVLFRLQDSYFESLYQQNIKEGATNNFCNFFNSIDWERYDWNQILKNSYEKVFGFDNVYVIPFESFLYEFDNPVSYILSLFDLPNDHLGKIPILNYSLSKEGCHIFRVFNKYNDDADVRYNFRVLLEKHFKKKRNESIMPNKFRSIIKECFYSSNMDLAKRYNFHCQWYKLWEQW